MPLRSFSSSSSRRFGSIPCGQKFRPISLLFDVTEGRKVLCFTLEDERREIKVPGETCIPAGEYQLTLRTEGRHHQRYKDRYGENHKGMLWVRDVPDFTFILIHVGNKDDDTDGCLLLGDNAMQNLTEDGSITASRSAYQRVYPPIAAAIERGEDVSIHYVDYDSGH